MLQKLKDLKMALAGSRKAQVIAAAAVVVLISYFVMSGPTKRQRLVKPVQQKQEDIGRSKADEASNDVLMAFQAELEKVKKSNEIAQREAEILRKQQTEYEQRTAEILRKMLDKMQQNSQNQGGGSSVPAPVELGEDGKAPVEGREAAELESFGNFKDAEVAPPPLPNSKKIAYIGAGDSVRVKLLAGVNAPTDGTPYPVVFKLVGDVIGPDNSLLPLGEARLIAAAQGSLTDSRALFRLTSVNLRLPNGQRKVMSVDGWIVGEDGIRGMQGVLIDPIGKAIGGAGFAAGLQAAAQGVRVARTRVRTDQLGGINEQVTGNIGEFAAASSVAGAGREWSSIIRERLNDMVPVVQVLSGREGTAVFARSLQISDLFEQLEDGESVEPALD
jgi:hypothetical protein